MLQRCIEQARLHDSKGRCSVWAIALNKRGRVIAEAGNQYGKTHPFAKRISSRHGVPERDRLHAELKVLLASRGQIVDTLLVARVDRTGKVRDGKPCICCKDVIDYFENVQGSKINVIFSKEN